jgi:hypothetical protein
MLKWLSSARFAKLSNRRKRRTGSNGAVLANGGSTYVPLTFHLCQCVLLADTFLHSARPKFVSFPSPSTTISPNFLLPLISHDPFPFLNLPLTSHLVASASAPHSTSTLTGPLIRQIASFSQRVATRRLRSEEGSRRTTRISWR